MKQEFSAKKTFTTDRLLIAPFTKGDFSFLQKLWQEEFETNMAIAQNTFALVEKRNQLGKGMFWLLKIKDSNMPIGTCELNNIDFENNCGEIGCTLKKEFRGLGYMKETLGCIINYAFWQLALSYLEANIDKKNCSSRRLFEKLGFVKNKELYNIENRRNLFRFVLYR